MFYLSW